MSDSNRTFDFSGLTTAERLLLAQDLLDSVLADTGTDMFTSEQLQEIDRRCAAADAGEISGEPWDDVFRQLTVR